MNFYKHHLGDYAAATAHLSWDEDCAYRRLLDQYYKREAPLPGEVKEVCRLARATSPAQRRAVETVLREFFDLRDGAWHQKRCDQEIGAAASQADTNRRIAEEREAKKRARIRDESLNGLINDQSTNRSPATSGEREPSQTPDSRLQTPDSRNTERATSPPPPARVEPEPPEGAEPSAAGLACRAIKAAGIPDVNPGHPGLQRLLDGGVTAQALAATAAELATKPGKARFALLLATHEGRLRDAATAGAMPAAGADPQAWRKSDGGIRAMAAQLGVQSRPGDLFEAWDRRVFTAWQRAGNPPPQAQPPEVAAA